MMNGNRRAAFFAAMFLACLGLAIWPPSAAAAEPVELTISDKVVVEDVRRFGLNFGDDDPREQVLLKERIRGGGFEGMVYRHFYIGWGWDGESFFAKQKPGPWKDLLIGSRYMILNGAGKGSTGTITGYSEAVFPALKDVSDASLSAKDQESLWHRLALKGSVPKEVNAKGNRAMLVEMPLEKTDLGLLGQHGSPCWVFTEGEAKVTTETGDAPPGSSGTRVVKMHVPGDARGDLSFLLASNIVKLDGTWRIRFWARGNGTLELSFAKWGLSNKEPGVGKRSVDLTPDWRQHELSVDVKGYPHDYICLHLVCVGGTLFLDNLSCQKTDEDANPTAFLDIVVNAIKAYRPGTLRYLQVGGSSLDNWLADRYTRRAFAGARNTNPVRDNVWPGFPQTNPGKPDFYRFNLHEFLALCREVGSDPWICVPGTLFFSEASDLMEYLAGPAETRYGRMRAALGQSAPWTEVFKEIYVEFGNEAWNFAPAYNLRGFNGADYWRTLIETAKASPHYSPVVRFQVGGWAANTGISARIAGDTPNGDGFAVAPYFINKLEKDEAAQPPDKFWAWTFGHPWHSTLRGEQAQNYKNITEGRKMPLTVYEVNHHVTGGSAAPGDMNRINASLGGALNVANGMLLLLQRQKMRIQNFFAFMGTYNDYQLWGGALSLEPGRERYRPTWLALSMLNEVLGGQMLEVAAGANNPAFTVTRTYHMPEKEEAFQMPYLQAYALRDGKRRSLVLINLHLTEALPVKLGFAGTVKAGTVQRRDLVGESIESNNEGKEPQVRIVRSSPAEFRSGAEIAIAAHSLSVLSWEVE
jgi:alpha-L-arabinofuranosidase